MDDYDSPWKEVLDAYFEAFLEANKMPYVTSLERLWLKQGEEKGRQEGRDEGIREGLLPGIELALQAKFGADAKALYREIEGLSTVAALHAVINAIRNSPTVDQLRLAIVEASRLANGSGGPRV